MRPPANRKGERPRASAGALAASHAQDLHYAATHYHAGRLSKAAEYCRRILQTQPRHADALHILGLIAWRQGSRDEAVTSIERAIAARPQAPQLHNSLGVVLNSCGQYQAAAKAFRRAVALSPDYPEALTNLGNALREMGQLDQAAASHRRALELSPNYAEAHSNLAAVLLRSGKTAQAIAAYHTALKVRPDWAELHNNLGNALAATQQFSEAAAAYRRSIALGPAYVDAHANLGLVLHRMGRLEEAVAAHRDAIALRPIDARLWLSLSGALIALGRPADAEEACRKAITLDPKLPEARNNLGMALKEKGQLAEAVDSYSIALQLRPDYPEAHNNLGVALHAQGHFSGALAAYEQALGLDASYMDAHWNKALLHLLLGDFETGWREYESGWQVQVGRGHRRHERYPSWNGSPLAGKTLLVWGEQGIGDQIMFASLLPDLIAQGARCIVEADARLEALFCRSFPGLTFVARGDAASAEIEALSIDFQTSMGSVCRWLRRGMNDFPVRPGFLRADPLQVDVPRRRYVERFKGQLVVGISWRGGSGQPGRARSIPLADWAMILQSAGVGFVSLQYGDSARELATIREEFGVEIFRDEAIDPIANLDAFAAQTAAMDLVLSIDNSTVHMAGALNVPVWVLLPAVPEWRWLLGRSDSPWHASARLFRQAVSGDWSAPIAAAADELRQAVSSGKGIRNAAGASS